MQSGNFATRYAARIDGAPLADIDQRIWCGRMLVFPLQFVERPKDDAIPSRYELREKPMKRVLLTGAAGGVGQRLRALLKPIYPELRLSDIGTPPDLALDERFIAADLAALDEVEAVVDAESIRHAS